MLSRKAGACCDLAAACPKRGRSYPRFEQSAFGTTCSERAGGRCFETSTDPGLSMVISAQNSLGGGRTTFEPLGASAW